MTPYTLSSKQLLPPDSCTYISDAWNTASWLDHCVSTADAHAAIQQMDIKYNYATADHIPVIIKVNTYIFYQHLQLTLTILTG